MNKQFNGDQLVNLIQSFFKVGGGVSVGAGAVAQSPAMIIAGALAALVAWYMSNHSNATPTVAQATAQLVQSQAIHDANAAPVLAPVIAAPVAVAAATAAKVAAAMLAFAIAALFLSGCASVEKVLDPPLPGTTNAAPLVAFTNGSAYLLGHAVTSNQLYSAAFQAGTLTKGLILDDAPGATNYLAGVSAVIQDIANAGTYNQSNLQAGLSSIPPQNAGDEVIIDSVASSALSLVGVYVGPLVAGGTNSAPSVKAVLLGIAGGL